MLDPLAEAHGAVAATELLLSVGSALARAESDQEIGRVVSELVREFFGADVCLLVLRRPDGTYGAAQAAGELTLEQRAALAARSFRHASHELLERERRVIAIDDVPWSERADPELLPALRRRSSLLVPFVRDEELLGYWSVHFVHQSHRFTAAEIMVAEAIARQAAMALEIVHLRQAEREKSARLEALHAVTGEILAHAELEPVLEAVVDQALRLTGRHQGDVLLWDDAEMGLRVLATRGREPSNQGELRRSASLSLEAYRADEPRIANDYQSYPSADPAMLAAGAQAAIAVPLRSAGRPLGTLTLSERAKDRPFGEADLFVLSLLADYAALAIERAWLLQREREAARLQGAIETARGLAHELNQPLALVAGHAEILTQLTDPSTTVGELDENLVQIIEAARLLGARVHLLQRIVRIETREAAGIGRYIDLERSSRDH